MNTEIQFENFLENVHLEEQVRDGSITLRSILGRLIMRLEGERSSVYGVLWY